MAIKTLITFGRHSYLCESGFSALAVNSKIKIRIETEHRKGNENFDFKIHAMMFRHRTHQKQTHSSHRQMFNCIVNEINIVNIITQLFRY